MKITVLCDIVEGKLLNSPSISFITQIHTNVKKVNDGDAFFAKNQDQIQKAVLRGAFAIISGFEPEIIDKEIAWIKVDNLKKAITNTLRYNLLKYTVEFIYIPKAAYHLLKTLKTRDMENIHLLSDDIYDDFETINGIENSIMVFSTQKNLLEKISPNVIEFQTKKYDIKNLNNSSLFETSFSYNGKYFDKIKIPYLYLNDLLSLMELFEYNLDLKRLNSFDLFTPIFINKSCQIVSFGQTNRFILANCDEDICKLEIEYLKKFYSYANIKIIDCSFLSDDDIFNEIKINNYNALYCIKKDISSINNLLEQNDNTAKLF